MVATINDLLYAAGTATVRTLWLPLAVWTVIALPVYLVVRRWERLHALVRYYLQRALLLSLPLGLLAVSVLDVSRWVRPGGAAEAAGDQLVIVLLPTVAADATGAAAAGWGVYHVLGLLSLAAGLLAGWRLLGLVVQAINLARFSRRIRERDDIRLGHRARRIAEDLNIRRRVRTVVTSRDISPMTFGYRRPTVVIPGDIAEDDESLQMTLVHELTHVRRGDYLWHWTERLMEACLAIHPLVHRLRREIDALREMICDAAVLDRLSCSRKRYALLLYRTVVSEDRDSFVVAMSESGVDLQRRIEAMKVYTRDVERFLTPKHMGITLGGLLMMGAVFLVSCTDIVGPDGTASDVRSTSEHPDEVVDVQSGDGPEVFVAVEQMPELKGGLSSIREELRYPEKARQAGIEGMVVVQFVVDEQGNVRDPKVLRGIGAGCDAEAVRAVEQAEFEPGKQRGRPVRVKMSLPVRFALTENGASSGGTDASQTSSSIDLEVDESGDIRLNGRSVELDDLTTEIRRSGGDASTTVNMHIGRGTSMGIVNSIQQQLRTSNVTRINYQSSRGSESG